MRVVTPCRSSKCVHSQCFDATSWFSMMEQTTTYLCPTCERTLDYRDLIIDGYARIRLLLPKLCPDILPGTLTKYWKKPRKASKTSLSRLMGNGIPPITSTDPRVGKPPTRTYLLPLHRPSRHNPRRYAITVTPRARRGRKSLNFWIRRTKRRARSSGSSRLRTRTRWMGDHSARNRNDRPRHSITMSSIWPCLTTTNPPHPHPVWISVQQTPPICHLTKNLGSAIVPPPLNNSTSLFHPSLHNTSSDLHTSHLLRLLRLNLWSRPSQDTMRTIVGFLTTTDSSTRPFLGWMAMILWVVVKVSNSRHPLPCIRVGHTVMDTGTFL